MTLFAEGSPTAVLDGLYRYLLTRGSLDQPYALFVMLNPSTATALEDDQTISWCWRWCQRHGYSLRVVNLYAYRTKDQRVLRQAMRDGIDIVGPENDRYIKRQLDEAALVICAWGSGSGLFANRQGGRDQKVYEMIAKERMPHALRVSENSGQPWHPLYLPGDVEATAYHRSL